MPQWFVIGVTGVTCGGKTTVASRMKDYFLNEKSIVLKCGLKPIVNEVKLISQDEYFLPVSDARHRLVTRLNVINFELLTALDMEKMLADIVQILDYNFVKSTPSTDQNVANNSQNYCTMFNDFDLNDKQDEKVDQFKVPDTQNNSNDNILNILIIEGFLIFEQPDILDLCDVKYHFHLPYEICYERRKQRVYDPPDVSGYFEMCVWPHYERCCLKLRRRKDISIVNGALETDKIFNYILKETFAILDKLIERKNASLNETQYSLDDKECLVKYSECKI